ncbi:MAG: NAD(P)-dependent oxidoreductase [Elusimicrobia bacterium]|nr:NAD(P)-dependent oxidoreductase [Elusimicrobiota bacterium]
MSRPIALVTGATGFIGRPLIQKLAQAGYFIISVSRRGRGPESPCVQHVSLDINDPEAFHQLSGPVDVVIHAATQRMSDRDGRAGIEALVRTNILGTWNMLESAKSLGAKKVIYCSSLSVYQLPQPLPIAEEGFTYPVELPDSYYGISKLSGELLGSHFCRKQGIKWINLRLGRVYGPGEASESLLGQWIRSAQNSQEIVIYGDGRRSMDFIYLDDAVEAIVMAVNSSGYQGTLNISHGTETTWRELASAVIGVFSKSGKQSSLKFEPQGSRVRCYLDVSKARRELGFSARFSLDGGLTAWSESGKI